MGLIGLYLAAFLGVLVLILLVKLGAAFVRGVMKYRRGGDSQTEDDGMAGCGPPQNRPPQGRPWGMLAAIVVTCTAALLLVLGLGLGGISVWPWITFGIVGIIFSVLAFASVVAAAIDCWLGLSDTRRRSPRRYLRDAGILMLVACVLTGALALYLVPALALTWAAWAAQPRAPETEQGRRWRYGLLAITAGILAVGLGVSSVAGRPDRSLSHSVLAHKTEVSATIADNRDGRHTVWIVLTDPSTGKREEWLRSHRRGGDGSTQSAETSGWMPRGTYEYAVYDVDALVYRAEEKYWTPEHRVAAGRVTTQ